MCHGCAADADCGSQTCLPDGSCAAPGDVLYAATDGLTLSNCMPTARCALARALALVDGTKSTIRLDPGAYSLPATLGLTTSVRIVGRGAILSRDAAGSGAVLSIGEGTAIELDYVTVQGGDGADAGIGILCNNAALTLREATVQGNGSSGINSLACELAITHARIADNSGVGLVVYGGSVVMSRSTVASNASGGVSLTAALYDLENNLVARNGNPATGSAAVVIAQVTRPGLHAFDFNTVAYNQAPVGIAPGVTCGVVVSPLAFANNIVFGNATGATSKQVDGDNCSWTYSDIGPAAPAGAGNLASDPQFVDPIHNDFHLQASSPLRDAADPAAALALDIDGDARPQGAGRDIGADEIK